MGPIPSGIFTKLLLVETDKFRGSDIHFDIHSLININSLIFILLQTTQKVYMISLMTTTCFQLQKQFYGLRDLSMLYNFSWPMSPHQFSIGPYHIYQMIFLYLSREMTWMAPHLVGTRYIGLPYLTLWHNFIFDFYSARKEYMQTYIKNNIRLYNCLWFTLPWRTISYTGISWRKLVALPLGHAEFKFLCYRPGN